MKKFIALLLSVSLMVCFSVVPASAEGVSGASGSMTVSYNVQSSYLVNLPDLTCTEASNTFNITADYVHIATSKQLYIDIDKERTLKNDKFYLFKDGGTDLNTAMECQIYVECATTSSVYRPYFLSNSASGTIAIFAAETTTPSAYGCITARPQVTASNTYGAYTGVIYYTISIS